MNLTSRRNGRIAAGLAALTTLGLAAATAVNEVDPILRIYDGLWMWGGALLGFVVAFLLARRWPRERALPAVGALVALGAWVPLVLLALRAHMPILARLKGAIFLSSADVIGVALPVGAMLLWLALREHRPAA